MGVFIENNKSKIYDKCSWHDDAGDSCEHIFAALKYLKAKNMLNNNGLEIYNLGEDHSVSIHSGMLNVKGKTWMDKNYNKVFLSQT